MIPFNVFIVLLLLFRLWHFLPQFRQKINSKSKKWNNFWISFDFLLFVQLCVIVIHFFSNRFYSCTLSCLSFLLSYSSAVRHFSLFSLSPFSSFIPFLYYFYSYLTFLLSLPLLNKILLYFYTFCVILSYLISFLAIFLYLLSKWKWRNQHVKDSWSGSEIMIIPNSVCLQNLINV